MGNEIKKACKRMSWRNERWESPAEESDRSGFESLQKKVERLGRRVEELECERRKGKDSRQMNHHQEVKKEPESGDGTAKTGGSK